MIQNDQLGITYHLIFTDNLLWSVTWGDPYLMTFCRDEWRHRRLHSRVFFPPKNCWRHPLRRLKCIFCLKLKPAFAILKNVIPMPLSGRYFWFCNNSKLFSNTFSLNLWLEMVKLIQHCMKWLSKTCQNKLKSQWSVFLPENNHIKVSKEDFTMV